MHYLLEKRSQAGRLPAETLQQSRAAQLVLLLVLAMKTVLLLALASVDSAWVLADY